MPFSAVANKTIHYSFINQHLLDEAGSIIVFLHEGLGSIEQWRDFPQKLCNTVNLPGLVYDRYGYGKSEKLAEPRNMDYLELEARVFLPELIAKLGIKKPLILFGHSDGGSIALIYAGLFPKTVLAVISEAAHVIIEDISRTGIRETIHQFETNKLKKMLEKYHGENTISMFYGWANTWIDKKSVSWNLCNYIELIKCNILIIQGENDEYGSKLQMELIKQHCNSNSKILELEDCGHVPHFEKQTFVLSETEKFLNNNLS
jgi:pimeloyl-ACP methyl ester carboxylesterase